MNGTEQTAVETVKTAVTARSLFTAIKENRIEVLLVITLLHLLGVSDRVLAQASGICF
jgi:ABC-type protease/lipase transport system fused ATPase/permease subunit